jgi:aminopeptidase
MKSRALVPLAVVCAMALAMACSAPSAPPAPKAEPPATTAAPAAQPTAPTAPSAADLAAVASTMVKNAMIRAGDKVAVSGSVRDIALLEDLAIEVMKAGGQPAITVWNQKLSRRSYDEVPESYDSQPPTLDLGMVNLFDAQLSVETTEVEDALAGVPAARIAARAKAGQQVYAVIYKRGIRVVNLGNDLYPTAVLAARLGKPLADVSSVFWKAAAVPPETLRAKGDALRAAIAAGKQVTISSPSGTNLTLGVVPAKAVISDGAITPEKVKQGRGATITWLPAGELMIPATAGSADGKIVIDKYVFQGKLIEGLTLIFSKGRMTSMSAKSGLDPLKALFEASGGAKDAFVDIDLGLNPEVTLPTDTGHLVWSAAGAVTLGMGDDTAYGGTNASDFGLALPVSGATVKVDGKAVIENGAIK